MQGEIDKLNQQLKDKDAEYAAKEADRIFLIPSKKPSRQPEGAMKKQ